MSDEFHRLFEAAAGFPLPQRVVNTPEMRLPRTDHVFQRLAELIYIKPAAGRLLRRRLAGWLRRWPRREYVWAVAGYVAYCERRYGDAEKAFFRAVQLEPRNVDDWLDLALTLRHQGDPLGRDLLMGHAAFMEAYRKDPPSRLGRPALRALRRGIEAREAACR